MDIMRKIKERGITLRVKPDGNLGVSPWSKVSPDMRKLIRDHKQEIISKLNGRKPSEPVGTELAKLIPDWAVQFKGGCGCKDMAAKMDRWGVSGCIERSDQIIAHLLSQGEHLVPVLRMVPAPMKRVAAKRLLNRAISNAAKKASPHHEA